MGVARAMRALRVVAVVGLAVRPAAAQSAGLPAPDLTRLTARRDSLVAISATGRVGWMHTSLRRRADGGWRWTETLDVEDAVSLTTMVQADAQLGWRRLLQTGDVWDRTITVQRDTTDGTVPELNVVPLLVMATPWRAGLSGTWRVADAAAGRDVTLSVTCEGLDAAGPSGPAAWRVLVTRGSARTRYRVAAEAPWSLLGVATDGLPFRFSAP